MFLTTAKCPKCNKLLHLSLVDGYSLYCQCCDKNFYNVEVRELAEDWFNVIVSMSYEEYVCIVRLLREQLKEDFCKIYYLGYNCNRKVCELGFKNIPDGKRVKEVIKFFNSSIEKNI